MYFFALLLLTSIVFLKYLELFIVHIVVCLVYVLMLWKSSNRKPSVHAGWDKIMVMDKHFVTKEVWWLINEQKILCTMLALAFAQTLEDMHDQVSCCMFLIKGIVIYECWLWVSIKDWRSCYLLDLCLNGLRTWVLVISLYL